jgi:neutral amino acid transport system substrate-binding protein
MTKLDFRRLKRAGWLGALAAAVALAGPAAAQEAAAQDTAAQDTGPLKVGLLLPYTGQYAWVGSNVQPVAEMVAQEVNQTGGIGGRKIAFTQGDTEGVVDAGTTAAQKLVNVDNVVAILGPTSLSFSGAKQPILENDVPMVSPTAGTTALDRACKDVCYRTVPSDSLGGRAVARAATDAKYLAGEGAVETPVLMVGNAPALVSFKAPIQRAFENYGTPLAETISYTTGKPSYRSEVQTALKADPDGIVLVGTPEDSARIMRAAFQAGYQGRWFVTQDQTNAEFVKLAGKQLVEGIYGLEEVASEASSERNRAFEERFEAYSGEQPKIFATNTFDAMNVVALAMLRAHLKDGAVSRATLAANIDTVANPGDGKTVVHGYTEGAKVLRDGGEVNYNGLVGPIDFDAWGNITAPFGIRQVQDGSWTTVSTIAADALE